jgi:hypothetical protein
MAIIHGTHCWFSTWNATSLATLVRHLLGDTACNMPGSTKFHDPRTAPRNVNCHTVFHMDLTMPCNTECNIFDNFPQSF